MYKNIKVEMLGKPKKTIGRGSIVNLLIPIRKADKDSYKHVEKENLLRIYIVDIDSKSKYKNSSIFFKHINF